jgi:hypothetical protein
MPSISELGPNLEKKLFGSRSSPKTSSYPPVYLNLTGADFSNLIAQGLVIDLSFLHIVAKPNH